MPLDDNRRGRRPKDSTFKCPAMYGYPQGRRRSSSLDLSYAASKQTSTLSSQSRSSNYARQIKNPVIPKAGLGGWRVLNAEIDSRDTTYNTSRLQESIASRRTVDEELEWGSRIYSDTNKQSSKRSAVFPAARSDTLKCPVIQRCRDASSERAKTNDERSGSRLPVDMRQQSSKPRRNVGDTAQFFNVGGTNIAENPDLFIGSEQVYSLDKSSFQQLVAQKDATLVMFYDPSDPQCQRSKVQFQQAAERTNRRNHAFAGVDCTMETELCQQQNAVVFPVFKLYSRGAIVNTFNVPRTFFADNMQRVVERVPIIVDLPRCRLSSCVK